MVKSKYSATFHDNAARGEITASLVNVKANCCPMAVRLAWHSSGTFDKGKTEKCGGSNGATMRFDPELGDKENRGLGIMMDVLSPVKKKLPGLSYADIWTLAGAQAIKLCGGPEIDFRYGRTDSHEGDACPENGRLPDASKGAEHLRQVFFRMGFNDREIVCLSGAHTLGNCHQGRSGYDGPWTTDPLKFDNEYFRNLLEMQWTKRDWDGPEQYTDPSGDLMMLPSDLVLVQDRDFRHYVVAYAADEELFFKDFAAAFAKLISLGCPACCKPGADRDHGSSKESIVDRDFRELAMHGSLVRMKEVVKSGSTLDVNSKENNSDRTALHKASFFGHHQAVDFLVNDCEAQVNLADAEGDTPLHDACRFGHSKCVEILMAAGADISATNIKGETALDVARKYDKTDTLKQFWH